MPDLIQSFTTPFESLRREIHLCITPEVLYRLADNFSGKQKRGVLATRPPYEMDTGEAFAQARLSSIRPNIFYSGFSTILTVRTRYLLKRGMVRDFLVFKK